MKQSHLFFSETTIPVEPLHLTFHSIVAAVQCEPCQWDIIDIHLSIQASQDSFQKKNIQAPQSADKKAIYRGKQHLWYWLLLTFGSIICCFIFKTNSSGILLKGSSKSDSQEVPTDGYIKRYSFFPQVSSNIYFCLITHIWAMPNTSIVLYLRAPLEHPDFMFFTQGHLESRRWGIGRHYPFGFSTHIIQQQLFSKVISLLNSTFWIISQP